LLGGFATPVVVLEGPRAVGKTTLMREQIERQGFSYATLADPNTLAFARADAAGWIRTLPLPAIIDEAQLVGDLPLVLKEYVDSLPGDVSFVLTGSASIGRTGLGGADPLARRVRRMTMWPLTAWELADQPGSIVDLLFDGQPLVGSLDDADDQALAQDLLVGGFPHMRFPGGQQRFRSGWRYETIRSDLAAILSDKVLPDARADSGAAHSLLDGLLRNPGGILNVAATAGRVGVNPRTADRLISVFARLFLLHWLPNRATAASHQSIARAKIHPGDTSFSVESFRRAGIALPDDREAFGAVLESHVVNQLIAGASWAQTFTTAFYWRDAKSQREVDLVFEDDRGRRIGIEVKAAGTVHPRDLDGLHALQKKLGLYRGFVVYTGAELRLLEEDVWALPVSVLHDASAFAPPRPPAIREGRKTPMSAVPAPDEKSETADTDATVFLSYVHNDDDRLDGNIVRFAKETVDHYDFLTGNPLRLIWDRNDLTWGENWARRLEAFAETTTFLMAAVTPNFLKSEPCKEEVLDFLAAAKRSGDPKLFLPIVWVDVKDTDVVPAADPVLRAIDETQQLVIEELWRRTPGTPQWKDAVHEAAEALRKTITHRASAAFMPRTTAETVEDFDPDAPGLLDALANPEFQAAADAFKNAMEDIGELFTAAPPVPQQPNAAAAAMIDLGRNLQGPIADLDYATSRLGAAWEQIDSAVTKMVAVMSRSDDEPLRHELVDTLTGLRQSLELPGTEDLSAQLKMMGSFSKHLRPMSKSVSAAIRLLASVRAAADGWLTQLS